MAGYKIFDHIFKEIFKHIYRLFFAYFFNIIIEDAVELDTEVSSKPGRRVDFVRHVVLKNGEDFTIHTEFQTRRSSRVLLRLQDYYSKYVLKYERPVKQFVLYLRGASKRKRKLSVSNLVFTPFTEFFFEDYDPEVMLSHDDPAGIVFSILFDFKSRTPTQFLSLIVSRLVELELNSEDEKMYIEHLINLSRVRKLEEITMNILKKKELIFNPKEDGLFKMGLQEGFQEGIGKGREEGIEIEKRKTILHCFFKKNFSPNLIAGIVDSSLAFVKQVIKEHQQAQA